MNNYVSVVANVKSIVLLVPLQLNGEYDEIVQDSEEGEMEDPEVTNIEQV